jgi:putative nucleotidyltransferase with HDIG domain
VDTSQIIEGAFADRQARIADLLVGIPLLSSQDLRQRVIAVWVEMWSRSEWADLEDCPFTSGFPSGPRYSLIRHTNSVTRNALRMAETLVEDFEVEVDLDRLLAICLLHDVSKLVEHAEVDGLAVKSLTGKTFPHATLGAVAARDAGIDDLIVKTIILHPYHPPHTFLKPTCVEHLLQHWSDLGTADPLFLLRGMATHMEQRRAFEVIPS